MGSASCFLQTSHLWVCPCPVGVALPSGNGGLLLLRRLRHAGRTSLTTGVAGGLISPITAMLLAPLKGKFETLFLQIFTADQWPICYHCSLMLFTLLTCPPKRGHSDPCPIDLQSTRSPLDPGYISSLSPRPIPPYSHNTPEPKSDAP